MVVQEDLGLYFHIPFCVRLCHYCDFAKTSRYSPELIQNYLRQLESHFNSIQSRHQPYLFASVFFGGGTPGMFDCEYEALFAKFRPWLRAGAEISLEANPNNVSSERLKVWKSLGVTRLSIGVQTFAEDGLKFLTRDHSSSGAVAAIEQAMQEFNNFNIDLIYGWQQQTEASWRADLRQAIQLGIPHLSLYNLTYEPKTPIGRRNLRGIIPSASDDKLYRYYAIACELLADAGYVHEEVSNWSKPGNSCLHNARYWQGDYYIGVGAGAHGFLPDEALAIGQRYYYDKLTTKFLSMDEDFFKNSTTQGLTFEARDADDWLVEYIGSSFRTRHGCDLQKIKQVTGKDLQPRPVVQKGLEEGLLIMSGDFLHATPAEWFRENAWAVELIMSF